MPFRRRWLIAFAWTAFGCISAAFIFTNRDWRTSWPFLLEQSAASFLFAGSCAALCLFVLPILSPAAKRRLPRPLAWAAIVGALVVIGTIGSLFANALAVVLGIIPGSRFLETWYPGNLKISIYFTLIFGLAGTTVQELRARLSRTTLELRTRERDEAEARRLAAEAQLASLEARVDPHFLFNTLNSIAALVRDKPADAERVIEQLASLMRSSLDRRVSLVTLEEELAVVTSYLEIERVRFGDRLRFAIAPAADAARALVPRLSLQTLAENSVKFAVAASREGASITVHAAAHDGRLRVSVEDDGPGFDVSSLPDGHGLQLLRSRLAMTFGDRAALVATSRPGRTVVALDLPFETVVPQPPSVSLPPTPKEDRC